MTFTAIYEAYFPKVYRYAYRCFLHRETAEDVTEDIFVAVLRNFSCYDAERGSVAAWIGAIAHNQVKNYCQKAHDDKRLEYILSRLTIKEKDFLELRYVMDMTNEEIASLLGVSREAVHMRYSRLLDKCRQLDAKK